MENCLLIKVFIKDFLALLLYTFIFFRIKILKSKSSYLGVWKTVIEISPDSDSKWFSLQKLNFISMYFD